MPLRGRAGAIGVLTIERLGVGNTFTDEEFDLVKLFAGQVSIALQNAEVFRAVEIRAQTDDLTGLLNHGTFEEYLDAVVRDGTPFGLIMLDLDDFREINNSGGHQAGDEVLRRIADGPHAGRPRHRPACSATAATSSPSCCRTPIAAGAWQVAERARRRGQGPRRAA